MNYLDQSIVAKNNQSGQYGQCGGGLGGDATHDAPIEQMVPWVHLLRDQTWKNSAPFFQRPAPPALLLPWTNVRSVLWSFEKQEKCSSWRTRSDALHKLQYLNLSTERRALLHYNGLLKSSGD